MTSYARKMTIYVQYVDKVRCINYYVITKGVINMIKIKKITDKEKVVVSAQAKKPCSCAGQVLKYPPVSNSCLYDCDDYNQPRWYEAQCQ